VESIPHNAGGVKAILSQICAEKIISRYDGLPLVKRAESFSIKFT